MRGTGKLARDKTRPGLRLLNTFNAGFCSCCVVSGFICLSKTQRTTQAASAVWRLFGC